MGRSRGLGPRALGLGALLLLAWPAAAQRVAPGQPDQPGGYASDRLILKLKPGVTVDARGWQLRPRGPAPASLAAELRAANQELSRRGTLAISALHHRLPDDPALAARHGLDRYLVVHLPPGTATPQMAASLARQQRVFEVAELDGVGSIADTIPDDPNLNLQYGLLNQGQNIAGQPGLPGADINAPAAWDITTGSADMVLAVIDAGVSEHTELAGRLLPGWAFDGGNSTDTCGSHGTHVAGIAAANTNNALGTAGVNWQIKVRSYRVLAGCNGLESNVAAGIMQAVLDGVDVINMSLQFYTGSQALRDAVIVAYEAGIPMLAATGNNQAPGIVAYPARWPETIAIAATDNRDFHPSFSNSGPEVDVSAPGDDIYSLTGLFGYGYKDGTSMATPFVSGLVGLMLTLDPALTAEEIRTILRETADDVQAAGFDTLSGWGRIDAHAALMEVKESLGVPGDVNGDGVVNVSDVVLLLVAWGSCDANCDADLDGDGLVAVSDLVIVFLNWS
jgi:subtilisin family serine protease